TQWKIQIDGDRTGNYDGTNDDITAYVLKANWFTGMRAAYENVTHEPMMICKLRNVDRRFSPENTGGPLYGKILPHTPARVVAHDGVTERVMWQGWLEKIKPGAGRYGHRTMEIQCLSRVIFYAAVETKIALQENKRTDEIIGELISEVPFTEAGTPNLDEGRLTLAYAADNWVRQGGFTNQVNTGFDVYRGIRDITMAERGRFFFDREGNPTFWNREFLQRVDTPVKAKLSDNMAGMDYIYAGPDHLKNDIVVIAHPRTISESADEILWELGSGLIRVVAGETRDVYASYEDDKDTRVGGKEVRVDAADLEFQQGEATVTVDERANGANLTFTNNSTVDALVSKCIVRGRKIVDRGRLEATSQDTTSITDYGQRTMRLNLASVDNLEDAEYIASYELTRRGTLRGQATSVTLQSHALYGGNQHARQLDVTIGDLVTIKETQTGHGGPLDDENDGKMYYVIGESHEIEGEMYATQWYLEPTPNATRYLVGVAGRSELEKTGLGLGF
ncbi:MAG: hypothetical protein AAF653_07855, partial [Chloroflexota bacterium]